MTIKKSLKWRVIAAVVVTALTILWAFLANPDDKRTALAITVFTLLTFVCLDNVLANLGKDPEDIVTDLAPRFKEIRQILENRWDHRRLGDRDSALSHLTDELRSRNVRSITNTDFRFSDASPYNPEGMVAFKEALRLWLQGTRNNWTEIRGRTFDRDCLSAIVEAAEASGPGTRFVGRIMTKDVVALNFTILEYSNEKKEVLFGWGRRRFPSEDEVFGTSDSAVVRAFQDLCTTLESWSTTVRKPAELLETTTRETEESRQAHVRIGHSKSSRVSDHIDNISRDETQDEDLRIATVGFSGGVPEEEFKTMIQKGVRIRIVMLDARRNWKLVQARNKIREDGYAPDQANPDMKLQMEKLRQLQDYSRTPGVTCSGWLEVRHSNVMPPGFIIHARQKAVFAMFWARHNALQDDAPLIEADEGSEMWRRLGADWRALWTAAALDEASLDQFDALFGDGASSDNPSSPLGVLIVRSDEIEHLAAGFRSTATSKPLEGTDRSFKARRWIDACDTEGVQSLQELFWEKGFNAPRLCVSDGRFQEDIWIEHAPFEITFGGFTSRTQIELEEIGRPWMTFVKFADSGDTLSLPHEFVARSKAFFIDSASEPDRMTRVLPRDWRPREWIEQWRSHISDPHSISAVRDYALILRHTTEVPARKVHFYLVGFSETGTAAAGVYLAKQWQKLWHRFCVGRSPESKGDFLLLIEGPSNMYRLKEWEEVESITPDEMWKKDYFREMDTLWMRRMRRARSASAAAPR